MQISEIIKARRRELALTLRDIAIATGVSDATVLRWETGEIVNVRSDKIASLARILQISPARLTGDDSDPMDAVCDKYGLSDAERGLLEKLLTLSGDRRRLAMRIIRAVTDENDGE